MATALSVSFNFSKNLASAGFCFLNAKNPLKKQLLFLTFWQPRETKPIYGWWCET